MKLKTVLATLFLLIVVTGAGATLAWLSFTRSLPQMIKVEDFKPLLVSEVYARGGEKIGEYYRENRTLVPYEKFPQRLIQAFTAAEDDSFFEHDGINYMANIRAMLVNIRSGQKKQGASTITQQVARSLLLTSEKTYTRKIKEVLLSYKMEENLSKQEILYLYLNQIYFGQGAHGIGAAAETYFRKTVDQLTVAECALLAGLPKAPSDYSPVANPQKAKDRQKYVLQRMVDVGSLTAEEAQKALSEPIQVFLGKEYKSVGPFFVETLRQILVQALGEKAVLDEGLRIYTSLDFKAQQEAQTSLRQGLREIDKRQGFRGPIKNIESAEEREKFLLEGRRALNQETAPVRVINAEGNTQPETPLTVYHKKNAKGEIVSNLPEYVSKDQIVDAIVTKVDDKLGLTTVRFAETIALMDIDDMSWARKPDPRVRQEYAPKVSVPSKVLQVGDVIQVRVMAELFSSSRLEDEWAKKNKKKGSSPKPQGVPDFNAYAKVALEQEPAVEGALLSFDQKTGEAIAMVGGYDFKRSKFNRTIQARRQTGSAFKTIVYASALDKGYTPATPILDAPIVYETNTEEGQETEETKTWKPHNYGQKFVGDILFRNAFIKSLNIPTIKILESIGIPWVIDYSHRLGVFSAVNPDLSLGLGSSSLTLFEMTKVFSHFGRLGKRIHPTIIHRVLDKDGNTVLENVTLDKWFEKEMAPLEEQFEQKRLEALNRTTNESPPAEQEVRPEGATADSSTVTDEKNIAAHKEPHLYFKDPDQLISPETAYVMTTLLSSVIHEEGGTGARARALGRPSAGKTGSTNGYFDAWFIGFTPQLSTGVWVGFDEEKSLGVGETGGHAALPIWLDYMKAAHEDKPIESFRPPPGVVLANIDNQSGNLASSQSSSIVSQAFISGTEPTELSGSPATKDETEFYKEDLTE